jgi:hypothetical protein
MAKRIDVPFIVEYRDGSKAHFDVDQPTLRSGDHVARIIAGEMQRRGSLPAGEIVSVKRDDKEFVLRQQAAKKRR